MGLIAKFHRMSLVLTLGERGFAFRKKTACTCADYVKKGVMMAQHLGFTRMNQYSILITWRRDL